MAVHYEKYRNSQLDSNGVNTRYAVKRHKLRKPSKTRLSIDWRKVKTSQLSMIPPATTSPSNSDMSVLW